MLGPHHAQSSPAKWLIDAVAVPDPAAPPAVLRCHRPAVDHAGRRPQPRRAGRHHRRCDVRRVCALRRQAAGRTGDFLAGPALLRQPRLAGHVPVQGPGPAAVGGTNAVHAALQDRRRE
ncbi:hypothetical protein G6F22_017156 [Rhizopus arrhizus]|nr:hypothetical protein G6F22_017156 [Rhizopus arrhizus]KAG1186513.1 hypothetical protein G6F35_014636 [Rhizopus arrhizus]